MGHMKDFDRRIRNGGDDAIAAASELLPRWISVDEEWPEHLADVLVAYKCGKHVLLGVGEFDGTIEKDGLIVPYFKGIGGFEVTHWMPLPEPPSQ